MDSYPAGGPYQPTSKTQNGISLVDWKWLDFICLLGKDPSFLHVCSEDIKQTGQMSKLLGVEAKPKVQ